SLRRHAVSSVPLRTEEVTGIVLSAAYLVERELWQEFSDAVEDEKDRHQLIHIELSGPWPPYDFAKMQFGARAFCPDCGTWNRSTAASCSRCNARLPALSRPAEKPDEEVTLLRQTTGSRYRVSPRLGRGG